MVTTITWLCPSVEWHGLDILSSVSDNCQPLNLQITWITSDWLERRMPPDALGNNRCSCQGNIISDVTRREFIWKVHLMIPLQFGSFRVRYDPAFEIDVVLLLKFSNKNVKVWYQYSQETSKWPLFSHILDLDIFRCIKWTKFSYLLIFWYVWFPIFFLL